MNVLIKKKYNILLFLALILKYKNFNLLLFKVVSSNHIFNVYYMVY